MASAAHSGTGPPSAPTIPRDVAEMALAHSIGDKVEAAYRRGDLFERRKLMMEEWATFVRTTPSAKVVSIGNRRRGDLA